MRVLIIGGFGFIGGRLAQHLSASGHDIILGSRMVILPPAWLPEAEVVQTRWEDRHNLEEICTGVDVVIHAAGMNAGDCAADPVAALECNGLFVARLVRAAISTTVKRFIYLSTAHVYASPLVGVITEETCPRNLHPYATSHLAGENAVLSANARGEIEGTVLRISNAFGAPAHKNVNCWMLLLNDLCKQVVQSGRLVLHTCGCQERDFIGLTDVCSVIDCLISCEFEIQKDKLFNVGAGVSNSVLQMAQLVQQRCTIVLGYEPVLQCPKDSVDEQHLTLTYRRDRLSALGINSHCTSIVEEVDKLLRFCMSTFNFVQSLVR